MVRLVLEMILFLCVLLHNFPFYVGVPDFSTRNTMLGFLEILQIRIGIFLYFLVQHYFAYSI